MVTGIEKAAVKENPLRNINVLKLCINCNFTPTAGNKEKAAKVLEQITGQTPFASKSKFTVRSWGVKRNDVISLTVTVTGKKAIELIGKVLMLKENELHSSCFTERGAFGVGIKEHIDLGIKYDPNIGIYGMNFYVVLGRAGERVSKRRRCKSKVGNKQKVSKEEGMDWVVKNFGVLIKN